MTFKDLIATAAIIMTPIMAYPSENESSNTDNNADYMTINISIDGTTMSANLVDNSSTKTLIDKLKQDNVTYTANDYGGFEKVGWLGFSLPRNDQDVTTSPGDIILYQSNNLCLYYARNSWDFTPMGKINFQTETELREFLKAGKGQITVTLSLPERAGIDEIEANNVNASAYYNLKGEKVGREAKGVVISKENEKYKKIVRK